MFPREIWYFEASAINFLEAKYSAGDARATRDLQRERGRWVALSPITLFELLGTRDAGRKEQLLYFAQNFFEKEILLTPEESIARYVNAGCPINEQAADLRCNTYGKQWREMVEDTRRTLRLDDYSMWKTDAFRNLAKLIYRTARDENIDDITDGVVDFQIGSQWLLSQVEHPTVKLMDNPDRRALFRTAALLIFLMFCAEISPNANPYKAFWRLKKIDNILDRYTYVTKNHPELIFRGPFLLMAIMARLQAQRRFSRGLLFDCLHAIYLPYCDFMFSNDRHFVELSQAEEHPNFGKIQLISEVPITHQLRPIDMPNQSTLE